MWFRRDLRASDNRALHLALSSAERVTCLFTQPDDPSHREARVSRVWARDSWAQLARHLGEQGCEVVDAKGAAPRSVPEAARAQGARTVYCQRDWTPSAIAEEEEVRAALRSAGIHLTASEGQLLVPPEGISTASGTPYRVFGPFYRAWSRRWSGEFAPERSARVLSGGRRDHAGEPITHVSRALDPIDPARHGAPGEAGALGRLGEFMGGGGLASYAERHDSPAVDGTSRLSVRLATGELSPHQVAEQALASAGADVAAPFIRQLAWREFSYHVMHHFPHTAQAPLRPEYARFPWNDDERAFTRWRDGLSGYPFVDAGMRQLNETGWMHNRVRMVCASLLTKDLLVPWQRGERYFAERLVDYDHAVNVMNWQWVAGSGADAAPYYRIFNPVLQGRRFDADGDYVRRWVPELRELDARWIHRPWETPAEELDRAGLRLGKDYPLPIVDHAEARARALAAFSAVRGRG